MTRPRWIAFRFEPISAGLSRSSQLEQERELAWIGVLRFIENHAERFFTHFAPDLWMLHQLERERDLIVIRQQAALDPKRAIVSLHLSRDAKRCLIDPAPQRREGLAFDPNKVFRFRPANRPA